MISGILSRISHVLFAFGMAAIPMSFENAFAARHAVIVGVSNYPKESGAKPLPGASNDVTLLRDVLVRNGFQPSEISLLADGIAGAISPTRNNILQTLQKLAAGAKNGDFFFIHFSGHGSQQPVDPKQSGRRPEPDGLNEIFLPIDIGRWDGDRSTVTNAIVDYELDGLLESFLAKDAFVWAVFDACHSASLMRGSPSEEVNLRHVSPQDLGIPQRALDDAAAHATTTRGESAPEVALDEHQAMGGRRGGFVAFYAAQTTEVAPEMALPASLPPGNPDKHHYGVLTFTLAEALSTYPRATYRQLSQFILSRYSSQYISNKPTPVFTGSSLDAVAFGDSSEKAIRQWAIGRKDGMLQIPVGRLGQVTEGSILAIIRSPLAPTEEAIGKVEVSKATLFSSELRPIAEEPGKTVAAGDIPDGAYARLIRPAVQMQLRVAQPTFTTKSADARKNVEEAVATLRGGQAGVVKIDWQPAGRTADVRLHEEDGQLWLLPASGSLVKNGDAKTSSIATSHDPKNLAELLGDSLTRIGKALNLIRLAEQIPQSLTGDVEIKIEQLPRALEGKARDLTRSTGARLQAGDQVGFVIGNKGRVPVDVTLLYVDSAFGIDALFPQGGENNRIEPGGVLRTGPGGVHPIELNATTVGTERLIVIASTVTAQGERVDYSYLAQPRLERTRSIDTAASMIQELLDEAAFGVATRSAGRSRSEQALMRVFTWEVTRRSEKK